MTCRHCGHPVLVHGLFDARCEVCPECPGLHARPVYGAAQLSGRLATGAERGHGTRWHAVPIVTRGSWTGPESWGTALCGATPGRRSGVGFVAPLALAQGITCPRCLRKLEKSPRAGNFSS